MDDNDTFFLSVFIERYNSLNDNEMVCIDDQLILYSSSLLMSTMKIIQPG
jgi:hypothetical protein